MLNRETADMLRGLPVDGMETIMDQGISIPVSAAESDTLINPKNAVIQGRIITWLNAVNTLNRTTPKEEPTDDSKSPMNTGISDTHGFTDVTHLDPKSSDEDEPNPTRIGIAKRKPA